MTKMQSQIIFTNEVGKALDSVIKQLDVQGVYILADANTVRYVVPQLQAASLHAAGAQVIEIAAGDSEKTLATASIVWQKLVDYKATRRSVLVNVGGGMVTDLGGFVAATYRRGMPCINIPTTILGAVDAAVGGKTAVNFDGLKNMVGVFAMPAAVIVSTLYFSTLPDTEILSGFSEMLKHALLKGDADFARLLNTDPLTMLRTDAAAFMPLLAESVKVKEEIVVVDPHEHGLRKALNLGHTAGHAFEELALNRQRPIPHGFAVAYGLVVMSALSSMKFKLSSSVVHNLAEYVATWYGAPRITCDDYPELINLMQQDKKNSSAQHINFTLLKAPGQPVIDCIIADDDITAALDITRDLLHI